MTGIEEAAVRLLDYPGIGPEVAELALRRDFGISADKARETIAQAEEARAFRTRAIINWRLEGVLWHTS